METGRTYPALGILLVLLLTASAVAQDQNIDAAIPVDIPTALEISIQQQELIASYGRQLAELESRHGPYDPILLETLSGLTEALIEAGDYPAAQSVLSRRQQLLRSTAGLSNPDQVPVLGESIANHIRMGEWNEVTAQFQFLQWLQTQESVDGVDRLQAMADVAGWLLAMVYLDHPRNRTRNFLRARELQREMGFLAEDLWGEDGLQLIPWLYRQALDQYRLYAFLTAEDELGYDAYEAIQQFEFMNETDYLRRGLNIINRIIDLLEPGQDPVAKAIAMIYKADFQTLLGLGSGVALYGEAAQKLQQAGIESTRVAAYFARPVALPLPEFAGSFEALEKLSFYDSAPLPALGEQEPEVLDLGRFTAWNESLAIVMQPALPDLAASLQSAFHEVQLEFRLNSQGRPGNPKVLSSDPDSARLRRDAREALKRIQFRPRLEDGRRKAVDDVVMRLRYPASP